MGWSGEKSKVEAGHWSGQREKKLPVPRSSLLRDAPLEVVPPHIRALSVPGERSSDALGAFLLSRFCSRAPYTCPSLWGTWEGRQHLPLGGKQG